MKKQIINEIEDFRLFIERMELLKEQINNDIQVKSGKCKISDFYLSSGGSDNMLDEKMFSIPYTLKDYEEIWDFVCNRYNMFLANDKNPFLMFFDVYWTDKLADITYYDAKTLFIYFSEEKGIYYDLDAKFKVGDFVSNKNNENLIYEILEIYKNQITGNVEYKVEIFENGKSSNIIKNVECSKIDFSWEKAEKVAKVVYFEITTRVLVNKNEMKEIEDEDAIEAALDKLRNDNNKDWIDYGNCVNVENDIDCPYE